MDNSGRRQDPQRQSTKLGAVENVLQLDLLAPPPKPSAPVDTARLLGLRTLRAAIRYGMELRELEPKQVYEPLGMDKATWSRIENGLQDFPASKLNRLRQILGNDAVHRWLANEAGHELKPLKSDLEQRLDAALSDNARLRARMETIIDFVRDTHGGNR